MSHPSEAETAQSFSPRAGAPRVIDVALIEDNRLVLEGMLSGVPDLRLVWATPSADVSRLKDVKPNVVLLDLGLENGDSLRAARRVGQELPESRVVVMDLLPVHEDIRAFIQAGVFGFIMKDATLEELAVQGREVFTAAGGDTFRYLTALNDDPQHVAFLADLTIRNLRGWVSLS